MRRYAVAACMLLGTMLTTDRAAAEPNAGFVRGTIDLGVVVSNVDEAVKFYTEAVGFAEAPGFTVSADFCKKAGLTDGKPLNIRVLVLGDDNSATRLKLMEVPEAKSKPSDNQFIHSQLGYSYLTIFVADARQALQRLTKAGVKPVGEALVPLPPGSPPGLTLTLVRDPDGNLLELIGPAEK